MEGGRGARKGPTQAGTGERSEGAPPNRDPHRPWRRNLRFLRPKMRTLEKMSTRLPLQSPRFLLGLLRLLPADGRSQCCSRACRFWRIKPLAMAAAMVAPGPGPEEGGAEGRELGAQSGKGRRGGQAGGAGPGAGSAQSRLGPIALSAERGAGPANAPGARRGERREPEVVPAAAAAASEPGPGPGPGPRAPPLPPPSCPARLPGGRSSRLPSSRARDGGQVPAGSRASVRPERAGQDSASDSSGPPASAAAAARSRSPPVIVKCLGDQHLESAIFSPEISNQSASFPARYTPLPSPS